MTYKKRVAALGLLVLLSGCATEESPVEAGEQLIPVTEATELLGAGASVTVIEGPTPLLVPGSVRNDASEGPSESLASGEEPGRVTAMNTTLNQWGSFLYRGGTWGRSYDTVVGAACNGGQIRQSTNVFTSSGGGYCSFVRWHTSSVTDCRMVVHVGVKSFAEGVCQWEVYARPRTGFCGNSTCESSEGESAGNCADCDYCGNGTCGPAEDASSCINDCGYCGDGYCSGSEWNWCSSDCGCPSGQICQEM